VRKRIDATGYDTDKGQNPDYLRLYEEYFAPLVDKDIKLLELGVAHGGSLLLWRDYFERAIIVGLDMIPIHIDDPTGRIRIYQGRQEDTALLSRIAQEQAPDGFDIIIDDCSHIGELTRISFWHLFTNHLKPGGVFTIEDIRVSYIDKFGDTFVDGKGYKPFNHTFYDSFRSTLASTVDSALNRSPLRHFPAILNSLRGRYRYVTRIRSHDYGLIGLIKELIDACHVESNWGGGPYRSAQIHRVIVSHDQAVVLKSPLEGQSQCW
jgi:hypothetical protein